MPSVSTAAELGIGDVQLAPLRAPPTPANADASSFGAGPVNQAIGGLARAAGNITEDMLQRQAQQREFNSRIWAHTKGLDATLAWHDRLRTMQEQAPAGAVGFSVNVRQQFEEWKKTALDGAPDDFAKAALADRLGTLQLSVQDAADDFEDKASQAHAKAQREEMVDKASTLALVAPEKAGDVLRQIVDDINKTPGASEDQKAEAAMHVTHAVNEAMWTGFAQQDPKGVMETLQT